MFLGPSQQLARRGDGLMARKLHRPSIRQRLWGSLETAWQSIGVLASLVGTTLTVFFIRYPEVVPSYIVTRDIILAFSMIIMLSVVIWKYSRLQARFHETHNMLVHQCNLMHDMVHNQRDAVYNNTSVREY